MNWEAMAAIAALALTIITAVAFLSQKLKDAEEKGRFEQRVKNLEEKAADMERRVSCTEDNHSDTVAILARQGEAIQNIKETLEEIKRAIADLAARIPR